MCCDEKDLQYKIIDLNIEFYNRLMDIITNFMNNVRCDKNNLNKNASELIKKKSKLEIELKNKLDIVLFLMGRTSFIRGYCSSLLITCINKKYKKKIIKVIEKATKLENDLFDLHYCVC